MRQRRWAPPVAGLCAAAALGLVMPSFTVAAAERCSYAALKSRPILTTGDIGSAVKQAQCLSNAWGGSPPQLALDGVFDDVMTQKIEWIQGCYGLPPSGVIEARTWRALYRPAMDCYHPYPA